MLARLAAWLLVLLVLLPFSAPFSTCSLALLAVAPDQDAVHTAAGGVVAPLAQAEGPATVALDFAGTHALLPPTRRGARLRIVVSEARGMALPVRVLRAPSSRVAIARAILDSSFVSPLRI